MNGEPLRRLVMAQDTGGAIVGAVRIDHERQIAEQGDAVGAGQPGNVVLTYNTGTAFTGGFTGSQNQFTGTNGVAFRWVNPSASVTELPRPAGGTWSAAVSVSPSGNLALVGGNSADGGIVNLCTHLLVGVAVLRGNPHLVALRLALLLLHTRRQQHRMLGLHRTGEL